jgi:hypothetical protein
MPPSPAPTSGQFSLYSPAPSPAPTSRQFSLYSPAPSPAPSSTLVTSKKGFVVGAGSTANPNYWGTSKITTLNTGWYYTWGMKPLSPPPQGILFTPMFWNIIKCPSCKTSDTYAQAVAAAQSDLQTLLSALNPTTTENALLGYNEPDGTNTSASAAMRVGDAVAFWYNIINARVSTFTTPPRIGSPAMYGDLINPPAGDTYGVATNGMNIPAPSGITLTSAGTITINISNTSIPNMVTLNPLIWLDNFLIQVWQDYTANPSKYTSSGRGPYPDFICIHWYNVPDIGKFTNYLTNVYNKYNLPLRITEYSVADWNMTADSTKVGKWAHTTGYDWTFPTTANITTNGTAAFMAASTSWMNQQPFVEKYTWKERTLLALPGPVPATDQDAHTAASTAASNAAASVTSELAKRPPNTTSANSYQAMSTAFTAVAATSVTSYPIDVTPAGLISSTNPDVMNQSTLFTTYVENPPATITATAAAPPLSPLGQLYKSI